MHPRIDMRRRHAQRVLCDVDLNKRPLIPRKYEDAAAMVVYGALMVFLLLACAFFGGLQ